MDSGGDGVLEMRTTVRMRTIRLLVDRVWRRGVVRDETEEVAQVNLS